MLPGDSWKRTCRVLDSRVRRGELEQSHCPPENRLREITEATSGAQLDDRTAKSTWLDNFIDVTVVFGVHTSKRLRRRRNKPPIG